MLCFLPLVSVFAQIGQHDLSPYCCENPKKFLGCVRSGGLADQYGIGMSLYFKFLKTMKNAFLITSILACVPMYYNWQGSGTSATQKVHETLTHFKKQILYL